MAAPKAAILALPRASRRSYRPDVRVMAGRHDGGHVQRRPDPGRPGFRQAGTAMDAAARLTFDGHQAEKHGDLICGLNRGCAGRPASAGRFSRRPRESSAAGRGPGAGGIAVDVSWMAVCRRVGFLFQKVHVLLERLRDRVGIGTTSAFSCRFCSRRRSASTASSRAIRAFNSRISGVGGCQRGGLTKAPYRASTWLSRASVLVRDRQALGRRPWFERD